MNIANSDVLADFAFLDILSELYVSISNLVLQGRQNENVSSALAMVLQHIAELSFLRIAFLDETAMDIVHTMDTDLVCFQ